MPPPVRLLSICLDSWTWYSRFPCCIALYSSGLYFHHQSYPQLGVDLLWLHLFILSGVITQLIYSRILGTYQPGEFIFQYPISLPFFILFLGFSRQEYWSGLPFPSPVDHILSQVSTVTHLSWVALHGMAHSFIELDKVVVHVISLLNFSWLFSSVWRNIRDLWKLPDRREWLVVVGAGGTGSCFDGRGHAQ